MRSHAIDLGVEVVGDPTDCHLLVELVDVHAADAPARPVSRHECESAVQRGNPLQTPGSPVCDAHGGQLRGDVAIADEACG